jgi:hypothetical protein
MGKETDSLNTRPQAVKSNIPIYPYPMVRAGGLFLVFFGAGIIINVFLSGGFLVGIILAIISLMFSKTLSFGKPRLFQIMALVFAIVLEMVLFFIMFQVLPTDTDGSVRLMWILLIVGIHFLPMTISFGLRFGILGVLCIVNALTAMVLIGTINDFFLLVDGALKFGFGIWLFKTTNKKGSNSSQKNNPI